MMNLIQAITTPAIITRAPRRARTKTYTPAICELTQIVQTVQKEPLVQEYLVLAGVAQRERRHSCFALDALMVVKVDIAVNHLVGFREGRRFVAVDTLRF